MLIGLPSTSQLHTHAVALRHIFRHRFANVVQTSVEHKLVFVVHEVTTHRGFPSAVSDAIAHLIVHETFRQRRVRIVKLLLVVVARWFAMRHTQRSISLLVGSDEPSGTHFGVEEVELLVGVVHRLLVRRTVDAVVDVAILEIGKEVELIEELIIGTCKDVVVQLLTRVIVISAFGVERAHIVLHPMHFAKVVIAEVVERLSESEIETTILIFQRSDDTAEVAFKVLATHDVSLRDFFAIEQERLQSETLQFLVVFVFFVVTKAIGVVQSCVEIPMLVDALREQSLSVLLEIVVNLIIVERLCGLDISVRVVGAVGLELLTADTVPRMVGALLTTEGDELQSRSFVDVS